MFLKHRKVCSTTQYHQRHHRQVVAWFWWNFSGCWIFSVLFYSMFFQVLIYLSSKTKKIKYVYAASVDHNLSPVIHHLQNITTWLWLLHVCSCNISFRFSTEKFIGFISMIKLHEVTARSVEACFHLNRNFFFLFCCSMPFKPERFSRKIEVDFFSTLPLHESSPTFTAGGVDFSFSGRFSIHHDHFRIEVWLKWHFYCFFSSLDCCDRVESQSIDCFLKASK